MKTTVGCLDVEKFYLKIDDINSPKHYQIGKFEVIDIIEEACSKADHLSNKEIYNFATCIKYLLRAPFKGFLLKDLKKCRFHLNRWINILEKEKVNEQRYR